MRAALIDEGHWHPEAARSERNRGRSADRAGARIAPRTCPQETALAQRTGLQQGLNAVRATRLQMDHCRDSHARTDI
ncbi:hypothetical protein M3P21_22185 [Ruegeria sp. 2012CJ41-6]|uniref:Uncharacterized protein n=1 Tax=Ruegeria spongiae TaxID=2942209 RepID=A0ABT0QBE0_9RHOB|nr:hypothetical protein [Ruegeria spongiae]MCL6286204.1 hypothetical protein [Ruegeria spongiae]